jgi:hypothetical protein
VSRIDHWFSVPFTGIGIIGLLCREHRSVAGLTLAPGKVSKRLMFSVSGR